VAPWLLQAFQARTARRPPKALRKRKNLREELFLLRLLLPAFEGRDGSFRFFSLPFDIDFEAIAR